MKQKDIALFLVVAIFSTIFSVLLSNFLITPAESKKQTAEVVVAISSEFQTPTSDNKYFNKGSINPTKLIQIGDSTSPVPFNEIAN